MTHPTDDELVLHFYGEHAPADRTRIDAHLGGCATCQSLWDEIGRTLTVAGDADVPEPPPHFERVMWARVSAALPPRTSPWTWRALVPLTSFGALAIALAMGGRTPAPAAEPALKTAEAAPSPDAEMFDARERALFTALDGHLAQTEMLLIELMNGPDRATSDFEFARATAEDLVASGRLYKATAESTGHRRVAAVLEDLEPVLVEVARGPEQVNSATVRSLRERIDDEGLLFKVRAVTPEPRDR
jgi:multidrug efflux pump subunit AcrA (membrane-fusion protein)